MSELRVETWSMPAADLGPENPLPPLGSAGDVHAFEQAEKSGIPQEITGRLVYGRIPGPLPYTMQDRYTRRRRPREFRVAVLENELLRATFLLELGGRLWSLLHKPSGRELLETNPVFQPANLAVRNAWFSGGVEWNVGVIGHCPFTCSPLFAARVEGPDGTPVLRMYEFERIRLTPFQVDAYLPDGSPVLLVRVRITNPNDRDVPAYWWSNIAVPERATMRVIVPADSAYTYDYAQGLRIAPIPRIDGADATYATNVAHSTDYFYRLDEGQRPWIAALDGEGKGLVQVSTRRLRGRKLFVWGMAPGGRRWQEFLSEPGHAYVEVQAGLASTQMEYLALPARTGWSWLEAYGLMEADPAAAHGSDWARARGSVEDALERLIPRAALDAEHERGASFADSPPAENLQRGSGWGALERMRRQVSGEPPLPAGLPFGDESLGESQAPWVELLRMGTFPAADPDAEPRGYVVQATWREMLEQAVRTWRGDNWAAWYHLGVMRHHAGEGEAARDAWQRSLETAETPWALRNLALVAREEGRPEDAADLYVTALRLRPSLRPLAIECGRALLDANRPQEWLDLLADLAGPARDAGRMQVLEGWAALAAGDLGRVERILKRRPVVDDLREGEVALSDLWFAYHEQRLSKEQNTPIDDALRARVRRECPVPGELDFRASPQSHSAAPCRSQDQPQRHKDTERQEETLSSYPSCLCGKDSRT